jgi:hypothetical protein
VGRRRALLTKMFEDSSTKGTFAGFLDDLSWLIKLNPATALMYCGLLPFLVLVALHGLRSVAFPLQVYFVTTGSFVIGPFKNERKNLRARWFLNAMLLFVPIHCLILVGMRYLDLQHPAFVNSGGTFFFLVCAVLAIEVVVSGVITDHFRPETGKPVDSETGNRPDVFE